VVMWERLRWMAQDAQQDAIPVNNINPVNDLITLAQQNLQFQVPVDINFTTASGINIMRGASIGDLSTLAIYSNVVSNRLYGPTVGCGSEWYLGHGFSFSLDLRASLFMDFAKEEAKYELGDHSISAHRTRRDLLLVPGLDALFNLW